jgi:hypothetical protein
MLIEEKEKADARAAAAEERAAAAEAALAAAQAAQVQKEKPSTPADVGWSKPGPETPSGVINGSIEVPGVYYPGARDKGAGAQRHDGRPSSRGADVRGIWLFPIECEKAKPTPKREKEDQFAYVRGAAGWNSVKARSEAGWNSSERSANSLKASRSTRSLNNSFRSTRDTEVDNLKRKVAELESQLERRGSSRGSQSASALPPLSAPSGRGPL